MRNNSGYALLTAVAFVGVCLINGAALAAPKNAINESSKPVLKEARPKFSALTVSECTSLGGRVGDASAACTRAGQFTCKTVTIDGKGKTHVHLACIDRK